MVRFGNLVAKADGKISPEESVQLKGLLAEINRHLRAVPLTDDDASSTDGPRAVEIRRALDAMPTLDGGKNQTNAGNFARGAVHRPTDEARLQAASNRSTT